MLKVWTNASLIMALNFHILRNIPTSKLKSQPMNWIVWDEKKAKICDREEYYMSELNIAEWKNSFSNLDLWCVGREGIKYLGCADKPIDCESGFTSWKPSPSTGQICTFHRNVFRISNVKHSCWDYLVLDHELWSFVWSTLSKNNILFGKST